VGPVEEGGGAASGITAGRRGSVTEEIEGKRK
jgi:hypothetical protein